MKGCSPIGVARGIVPRAEDRDRTSEPISPVTTGERLALG